MNCPEGPPTLRESMAVTRSDVNQAEKRMQTLMKSTPRAVSASYDRRRAKIVIGLDNQVEFSFPPDLAEGLNGARPADLSEIEVTPTGLGLHFPRLDADLYVPALIEGVFGSPAWMAGAMGRRGGESRSDAKRLASRKNGSLGGRPKKVAAA